MGEKGRFEVKESFPAAGLVLFSTYAFGLLGVLAGRFGFGLSWAASAFLFMPFHGIACGIVNNESKRLVGNAAILLLFPILAASLSAVVTGLLSALTNDNMAEKTEGYSGADLRGVMARMRQVAFDRRLACYTYAFADEILAMTSPTTSPETAARIRQWERSTC